jgi:hypothetical protein
VDLTVTLTLPPTPGSYPAETRIEFTGIGEPLPTVCQNTVNLTVLPATGVTGSIFTKMARGMTPDGLSPLLAGTTSGNGNFSPTARELPQAPLGGAGAFVPTYWLQLARNVVTLEGIHLFDALPCLSLGDGLAPATAYASPAEGDPVCTTPAFHVTGIFQQNPPLDNQVMTVTYTDGSSEVIPSATATWMAPTGPMVASITIDGDYNVNYPFVQKNYYIYGWPVSSLPANESRYQLNTATVSGDNFATASVFVGMQTMPAEALLYNTPITTTHAYSSTWSSFHQVVPWPRTDALPNGGAVTSDPALVDQRRWAMMIPDNSGFVVIGGSATFYGGRIITPANAITTIPWTSVTPDFNGLGATRYLNDGAGAASMTGVTGIFNFGGAMMAPGVYEYYTYAGFTDSDPSDGGASCVTSGGTVVIDTTGIIGVPGVPRMLCKATNTILVSNPSGGMQITKEVANVTQNSGFVAGPGSVSAAPGDTVAFRVRVANLGTTDLTGLTVYDILPHVGDTGVIASQTGTPRGSTVAPVLSSVTVPAGWQAEYSASFNPCRPEVGVTAACDGTAPWTAAPSAAGTVKLTAATLSAGSFVDLVLEFKVPGYGVWTDGVQAWNSVGAAAAYGALNLLVEPTDVGFRYVAGAAPPTPSIAWRKTSTGGALLAGAVFRLTGPGGLDISVADNQFPDADPDDGKFLVGGLTTGNYTITETAAPPLYAVTATPLTATIVSMTDVIDAGALVNQLLTRIDPPGTTAVPTLNGMLLALLALALAGVAGWGYRRTATVKYPG